MNENNPRDDRRVHEPEILNPEQGWQGNSSQGRQDYWQGSARIYTLRNNDGCLALAITLALFIVCASSFGFLAAIAFIFFHIIIALVGSVVATRRMLGGLFFNVWQWRICNWVISFLLVYWFSGS